MTGGGKEKTPSGLAKDPAAIRFVVGGEARRALAEAQVEADPARLADGWERRFVADGARCDEMMRLYEELGYEVVADPIRPEQLAGACEDCRLLMGRRFRMIYTRDPRAVRP